MGFLSRWKTKTLRTQSCDYMVGEVGWMDDPFGRCTIKPTDCLKSGKRDILKHQENWCFTQIHSSIRLIRNDIFGLEVAAWLIQINRWQQFFFLLEIVNRSFQQWLNFCLGGLESSLLQPQSDIFLLVLSNYYLSTVAAHFWPYLFFYLLDCLCLHDWFFLRKISAFCFMFSFCHKHSISWTPGANFFSFDTNISLYSVTNYSVKSDWFSNMKKLCKLVALKDLSKAYLLIRFWHS